MKFSIFVKSEMIFLSSVNCKNYNKKKIYGFVYIVFFNSNCKINLNNFVSKKKMKF